MRVRLIVMLGLISVFAAAGAAIFGLGGASGPAVDVSHAQAPDEKVHREIVEALEAQPWADVIVALRETPAARRAPLDLAALQQQVAAEQENVLSGLSDADFQVLRRYDSIPAVFGRVSAAGLDKLADHPNVTSVHPNIELHATLSESVPMINADDVHGMGYTGAGVTVAVLDTGIDTNHADLQDDLLGEHCYLSAYGGTCPCGGATAHGPGCAEDGAGHGSHVSGIITSGGVVAPGGVAPDVGIIAFKVLDDSGYGNLNDTLSALNYIIANPGDGVDAINMSLGSVALTPPCDTAWPELTTAFNTLRSAGVTTFVSSGNDADKSHLGFPSCISSAVSVGAVYDANVGSRSWSGCTDSSTWADLVVCFSNSHSTLDLLAPGAMTTSSVNGGGTDVYGGTSMAAPHAAAVAALMLDANPSATPDQIESCMESTGVPVTDPANSVSTPRVDALAAVQCTAPSGDDTDGDGCADVEEQSQTNDGLSPLLPGETGGFDPNAWYDFYDVPVPAMPDPTPNGPKNQAIAMGDVLAVLFYTATWPTASCGDNPNANGVDYDCDKDGDTVPDGRDYDRTPSGTPNPPWDADEPDGAVAMADVLAVLAQTILDCSQPP